MSKKKSRFTSDDFELFIICLPTVIWYILFVYLPLIGVLIAFKNYRLFQGKSFFTSLFMSDWVGFNNFKFLFMRDDIWAILGRTIGYNFIFIIISIVIPVALAIMMSNLYSSKLAKVCQTAIFLPNFMSWVVVSYFVFAFLSSGNGLITKMLANLTGQSYDFYGAKANAVWPWILVFLNTWKTTGFNMVIYLATLKGIDTTYYEAAVIDGASKWQQVKYITLPMLKTIMIIMGIMAVAKIFNSDFGLFYQATKNATALYPSTQTLDVFIYNALINMNNLGMSSAAALFQSVVGCITIFIANGIVSKIDKESSFF